MKKAPLIEDKLEKSPTGGALIGKRKGQTIIHNKGTLSGYLVGKTHDEGGIKAVNKSTGQPLEMQGGEVVITAPAVSDTTKHNFNGKMMTNREILSEINVKGGGVAFAKGGDIPKKINRTGASYNYGGKMMTDHEIYKYITGGGIAEGLSIRDIANIHQVPLAQIKEQVKIGLKSESEHTSSRREQMAIVKDHLLENPEYYTLLKKAGLNNGGEIYASESDYVKHLLDRNLETDLAEYRLKKYLEIKNVSSGVPLPDSIRKDEEYRKLKRDFDLAFSKMQKKPIYKNSSKMNRVQRQKDLRRYQEIVSQIISQKFDGGGNVRRQSLVRDAKSGNTPARDFNNYNDILDIDADGVYGAETGLYNDGGMVNTEAFLNFYFEVLKDFFKQENNIVLKEDYSFFYKGEKFTIEPIVLSDVKSDESIREALFVIIDLDDEEVGTITFNPDRAKKFTANSEFFEWNNIRFDDGGMMSKDSLLAPNGKPSNLTPEQYRLVRTPEFKDWFGDWENNPENASKVVDENGEPLVVFHGTYVKNPFFIFDFNKADLGFHFGTYEQAKNRSETKLFFKGHKSIVNSFFLNIKNLFEISDAGQFDYPQRYIDELVNDNIISEIESKKNGFFNSYYKEDNKKIRDYLLKKYNNIGFVYENQIEGEGQSFIVLEPNQIKLADGNNTTFDAYNPDVRFDNGGSVGVETVLFAVRKGEPDYNEVLITNNPDRIEDAKKWALANGFDRLRVSTIDMREQPDFKKTFEGGGKMENGGYLDNLSEKSKKTIDSNYNAVFGIYDFDFNKESKRENYFEWLNEFKNKQFHKNLKKGINAISQDIDLLEKRKQSDKKFKDFEELILPTLGKDVKNPALSQYQGMVLMNPYATEEELGKALTDTSIFDKEGSIDKTKITESKFFIEEGINFPSFERFVEKNPEYKGVFNNWKKMFNENVQLHNQDTNAFRYPTIADLKDLKEELLNLDKSNFATGGSIKPYDANMDGDSADMMFDDGGKVQKSKDANVFSSKVYEWDNVPTNYRNTSKVKKVTFINNPLDKGLDEIVKPFLGDDQLRPIMTGINFDENGITATNAHILITLPYPNSKYDGTYDVNKTKKAKTDAVTLIDGAYPKYENIIPKFEDAGKPYLVDVYKLLQYTKTALNYANKTTYAIAYKFGDNDVIGFNGKYLITVLTAILKLGHEKIYVFVDKPNRAIVLSPNPEYELGNDEIFLTMPVIINVNYGTNIEFYGTEDIDYNSELRVYFDFNDSEIHNADGSVADFKMQYESNTVVDDKYLSLLSKITKKSKLAILNYVNVSDSKMIATDLEIELVVKDVNMPNGIYQIINNAPTITMESIDDFPSSRTIDLNEKFYQGSSKGESSIFDFTINSDVFEFYLEKLLLSVGKDDLRPVMSGICIHKTNDNNLFLVSTNAHTLCVINITEYCTFDKDYRELKYILPVKFLKEFSKLTEGELHIKCSLSNIFIESEKLDYKARAIDGNYPNYQAVIPKQQTNKIVFNYSAMNNCINSSKFKDVVAKYKSDKNVDFTITNSNNKLYLRVFKLKGYRIDRESELLEEIELCSIDFNHSQEEKIISDNDSLFLLMPVFNDLPKENQYFNFGKDLFQVMLDTITVTEVECYYSEFNRGYIFPIDAIDFKKTMKPEKTKQQKLSKTDIKEIIEIQELEEDLAPLVENQPAEEKEIIKLGKHFSLEITKAYYTNRNFNYVPQLLYKDYLFKYFAGIFNTKEKAINSVYNYLKTLTVSDKIIETKTLVGEEGKPKQAVPSYRVFITDRGGVHLHEELNKNDIQEFIEDVKNLPVEKEKLNTKNYVIESKGFTKGVGSSSYKLKRKKELEDLKNQIEIKEAIESLEILLETATRKDKKEIKEAIEVLQMLLDTSK